MAHAHHLPGAVEAAPNLKPVVDVRDIHASAGSLPSVHTPETLQIRRAAYHNHIATDTGQVRLQLERIATLLEHSFRRTEDRRKIMQLSAQPDLPTRRRESHSVAAGVVFTAPSTALPRLSHPELKVNVTQSAPKLRPVVGGTPISEHLARHLRKVVYGSTVHSFSKEWRSAGFHFHFHETPYPYGLVAEKSGTRGLILCVQAFIIKHLVFKYKTKEEIFSRRTLQPSSYERTQALIKALSSILWQAGEQQRACVCLPSDHVCFTTSHLYRADCITERVHLFDFYSYDDLELFIRRYLPYFDTVDGVNGCILFLYSLVLSRGLERIEVEMQGVSPLVNDYEELSQPLVNLILTGRATPYLHNDTLMYSDDGELLSKPLEGIPLRSDIGFLFWDKDELDRDRTQVGSMFKTPRFPIWITKLNGTYGLLFSINPDLVCDWRVEHRFQLHYFTGLKIQIKAAVLLVDTRFGRKIRAKTARGRRDEIKRIPAVDQAILSKWQGAEVDWKGIMPFV